MTGDPPLPLPGGPGTPSRQSGRPQHTIHSGPETHDDETPSHISRATLRLDHQMASAQYHDQDDVSIDLSTMPGDAQALIHGGVPDDSVDHASGQEAVVDRHHPSCTCAWQRHFYTIHPDLESGAFATIETWTALGILGGVTDDDVDHASGQEVHPLDHFQT